MRLFSFEKLKVWQKSRNLAIMIYKTTKVFPDDEKFGLISQMRRCAISISSNIAEGTGRHTAKDKARFTEIAYGSALELLNQTIVSNDLEFLTNENYELIRTELTEITAMLNALRKSQLA
ncbi:four helix bundle protein [Maribacter sp. 4U21]|uniref:four helix bundle protein n=1 Tax=Maribacter sp. 4U21 TaxID=1889779 RepID=UPI000C14B9A7|nr:four helix bundle protein [Maribacter sp. 4U21]PIB27619.1 four helix bundle protein [Maribacter sp. 4U21]